MCVKLLGEENDREKREVEECRSYKAQGMGTQYSAGGEFMATARSQGNAQNTSAHDGALRFADRLVYQQ